jgi:superfamily II DNA or RNA helicase
MYYNKFELLKLKTTEIKPACHYVSAACGSGKTYAVCSLIADRWINTTNVMIVCPTIKLIDEIDGRLSDLNINAQKITSDQESNVRRRIIEETKNVPDNGKVLLITWNAYADLPYFHKREN